MISNFFHAIQQRLSTSTPPNPPPLPLPDKILEIISLYHHPTIKCNHDDLRLREGMLMGRPVYQFNPPGHPQTLAPSSVCEFETACNSLPPSAKAISLRGYDWRKVFIVSATDSRHIPPVIQALFHVEPRHSCLLDRGVILLPK
ncbi:hypothetical protein KC19_VG111600 [Ceratodon purpureus]|uniref:Uncharacterized protein n=1 Tax=Ceratodon purpureus TaxID=3225 RepID=A0A8T0HP73_CERPU|nr:hypothetical protein KC19_VG111600 [Ceratodon purpureus]